MLLDLAGCGGGGLAAHAGGVDGFRGDEVQVLIVWDLVQPVAILQELDIQVLVYLLERERETINLSIAKHRVNVSTSQRSHNRKEKFVCTVGTICCV